ncbi:nucleotide exchange factor GrpE [Picosynechococcus sp. PCC 7003]|uniref:nucleotide exchange factor GrpE n=1 Tax=Picosynechococcus sp. PCC 7003 TaxID=374981 RepID=UPI000810512A|nr:nucleotide exchange factor GrpE [Picosynechococcus sp. PCC 7003]ANV83524.1 nucleotide exchange factor GrpE [Picosynechococcus sp. PCC 7003]
MVEDAKNLDSPIDPGSTPESVSDEAPETTIESNLGEDAATIEAQVETNTDTADQAPDQEADDTPLDGAELEAVIAALQQEVSTLRQQLSTQSQQTENFKSQYMRIAADFENFRKRTSKEKEEMELRIKCNTVNEILGAVDNFERARLQIKPSTDGEMTIHKSYQGVYKQLVDGLKKIGVSAMRPEGEEFDPNFHEAIFQEPTSEHPEGTVIEQVVRGYLLGDMVLRHAMVKVAAAPEETPNDETSTSES